MRRAKLEKYKLKKSFIIILFQKQFQSFQIAGASPKPFVVVWWRNNEVLIFGTTSTIVTARFEIFVSLRAF